MLQNVVLKVCNVDERTKRIETKIDEQGRRDSIERINILEFFPVSSLVILQEFMSNSDGNFKAKKEEFEGYLYSVCTLALDMDNFCSNLLKTLFRKEFIRDHRWPTTEYVFSNFNRKKK